MPLVIARSRCGTHNATVRIAQGNKPAWAMPLAMRLPVSSPIPLAQPIAAVAIDEATEKTGRQRREPNRSPNQAVGICVSA